MNQQMLDASWLREPMYFSCNIEPDMTRTDCGPLSRIRAFRDDSVLLFFAKFYETF
jgi:hypothetical protein